MSTVVLTGVQPWDGTYVFEDFNLTNRELHRIKEISGIRAGELIEALEANDRAAFVGFAVVMLARHGKTVHPDDLWDGDSASIRIVLGDEVEEDAGPPTVPPDVAVTESTGTGSGDGSGSGGV